MGVITMKKLNIGLIGAGFMAKAHSMAYATMPMFFYPSPAEPIRKMICDITIEGAKIAAERYGFENYTSDWRNIINNPEIDIIDIATPNNLHAEIAIAAAKAGKSIISEKPLARTTKEAKEIYDAVIAAGVPNMVAFNYRRTPAVALAKKFIDEGSIGKILNFRGTYLQDWSADPNSPLSWRFKKNIAGSGALGDIATHSIDMATYLVGEIAEVSAMSQTYISERPIQAKGSDMLGTIKSSNNSPKGKVDVDDENLFLMKFENGAVGSIEATRNAWGRNNFLTFELHGTLGSIYFDYEKRDELQVYFANDEDDRRGFRTIFTGPNHPYGSSLWPIPALGIGYGETKIIEIYEFFKAIISKTEVSPNFKDGYKISLICDAIIESSKTGLWTKTNCNNIK